MLIESEYIRRFLISLYLLLEVFSNILKKVTLLYSKSIKL